MMNIESANNATTLSAIPPADLLDAAASQSRWAHEERLVLRQMAKLATQSHHEGRAVFEVLHLISELVGLNRGRVLLYRENQSSQRESEIAIQYFYGLTRTQAARGRFKPGEGITGRAFASNRVAIVQDIDAEPDYLARTVDRCDLPQATVSYIAVPFEIEGRTAGVLAHGCHAAKVPYKGASFWATR